RSCSASSVPPCFKDFGVKGFPNALIAQNTVLVTHRIPLNCGYKISARTGSALNSCSPLCPPGPLRPLSPDSRSIPDLLLFDPRSFALIRGKTGFGFSQFFPPPLLGTGPVLSLSTTSPHSRWRPFLATNSRKLSRTAPH